MVLEGRIVRLEPPFAVSNCTDTNATRYARKLSVDAVLVIVTTAVPLQAASADNTNGTASARTHTRRSGDKRLERHSFIGWVDLS
jgi:hypothetical protein